MNELVVVESSAFMPALSIEQAVTRYRAFKEFINSVLKDGTDYGTVPGTNKPTLLKPGAEKLTTFFGLSVRFDILERTEDWTGQYHNGEQFFYYLYRCTLWRGDLCIAECDGSANSMESKYRWRWVGVEDLPLNLSGTDLDSLKKRSGALSEFAFAVEKAETSGRYGKPPEYWQQFKDAIADGTAHKANKKTRSGATYDAWEIETTVYRVPNEDIASQVNTLQKMAQKRALVGAVLIAVNASEFFTQDVEDLEYIAGNDEPIVKRPPEQQEQKSPPPAEAKSNGNGKVERPMEPAYLRDALHRKAAARGESGKMPATDKQAPFLARKFQECFAEKPNPVSDYHAALKWLWGVDSAKELAIAQAGVTLDWLLSKDGPDDTGDTPLHEHAPEEARRVLRQAMVDAGQQEMELE